MRSSTLSKVLRLAPHEANVLGVLTSKPQLPSAIVRAAGVPNASAYLAFEHLCERALAQKKVRNGKTVWMRADSASAAAVLSAAINELEGIKDATKFEIKHTDESSVTVHRGAKALQQIVFRALDLNPHERFIIYQGANVDDGWMEKVGFKNVLKINRLLKEKEIIGESFISENYFKNLVPYWGKEWAESYVDRLNVVYLIPEEFMPSHAEILIFRDRVLVLHFVDEVAVELKDAEMLLMFKTLFEFLKTVSTKVEPRKFLEQSYLPK